MCHRFSLGNLDYVKSHYHLANPGALDDFSDQKDFFPKQRTPILVKAANGYLIEPMIWGFVPYWAKDTTIGRPLINARAETLFEKPAFKHAVKNNRGIIFAEGFYEWQRTDNKKQLFFIQDKSLKPINLAVIFEKSPETINATPQKTFAIVTTNASKEIESIHNRMPLLLDDSLEKLWTDPATPADEIEAILSSHNNKIQFKYHPAE